MTTLLAWLAPWLLGVGVWMLATGRPRSSAQWAALLGMGWLLGMLLLAWLLTALGDAISPQACVAQVAPWLVLVAVLACGWALWRDRALASMAPTVWPSRALRLLAALLLASLLYRAWLLFGEADLRPLFAWDAWLVWSVKPKVWYLLDRWVPFVDTVQWMHASGSLVFTNPAPSYPALIARLEVWFASGAGCWCESAFTVLWPALWGALLLAGYGQLRALGVRIMTAWVAVYALGSLPLLATHAALPGYADMWLGACFGLALLSWLRWQIQRDWRQLLLALVFALSLPWIKLEGAVWLVLWLGVVVLGLLPARWRSRCVIGAVLLLVLGLALGGFKLPIPGLGWVEVSAQRIVVPSMDAFNLQWHPVLQSLARALWVMPNWNLLFYIAPLIALWCGRAVWRTPGVNLMGLCLLGGAVVLFLLFTCTDAADWAANYTSSARLMLQWVPALVFFLALAWSARDARPASVTRAIRPGIAPWWPQWRWRR